MRFFHPEIERVFDTQNGMYNSLVIENQAFMTRFVRDIYNRIQGLEGECSLSRDYDPISMPKFAELLDTFIPFDLNRKALLTKITASLAKQAVAPEFYESTMALLAQIECHLDSVAAELSDEIVFSGISITSLIKSCAPEIRFELANLAEQVYNYMELVREFDAPKLFITLNMRAFVSDEDMALFTHTAILHGFDLIAIECREYPMLTNELRTVIDGDLCEIT